jgi:hypothetical protein
MPILIEWDNGEATARGVCDQCKKRIADAADGLALWEERDATAVGRRELFITHRECFGDFRGFRMSCTVGDWMKRDLGWLLDTLARDSSVTVTRGG